MLRKLFILSLALCLSPVVFADNHEGAKETKKQTKTELNETQQAALDSFKTEMKKLRQGNKENMKVMKDKQRDAFIKGDFDSMATMQ